MQRVSTIVVCFLVISMGVIYLLMTPPSGKAPAKPAVTGRTIGRTSARLATAARVSAAAPVKPAVAGTVSRVSAPLATAARPPAAAPVKPAVTGAVDRASAFFQEGKYAKAKEVLDGFIATLPAGAQPQELQKAQLLLDRVKGALVTQYETVQAVRQRSAVEESKRAQEMEARQAREKKMLADADSLFQQALAGRAPDRNYREAKRLYAQVASERALDAFNFATDNYDLGLYDSAQKVFEGLRKFIDEQRADDPQFKSGLGEDRERRIAEYLKKLPDAKDNFAQGALLVKGPVASTM